MNNCEPFEELLNAYLDGEATSKEQAEVEAHLKVCLRCEHDINALKELKGILGKLRPLEAPSYLWDHVQRKITKNKVVVFSRTLLRGFAAVAAIIVLFVGSITLLGYFYSGPAKGSESNVYFSNHAYHLMRQPLADHSSWMYLAEKCNFEVIASEE